MLLSNRQDGGMKEGDEKSGGRVYRIYGFVGGGMMENHNGLEWSGWSE